MKNPKPISLNFYDHTEEILNRMQSKNGGVLCTVSDNAGRQNLLTLGWGLIGPNYHGNPIVVIAVAPPRYSWRFLEEVADFVLAIPDDRIRPAVDLCGTKSGRDMDKFKEAGLTAIPSVHVTAPSIQECPINIECRIYSRVAPPHRLLTPEHREKPVADQHTIYFAEALGAYKYVS